MKSIHLSMFLLENDSLDIEVSRVSEQVNGILMKSCLEITVDVSCWKIGEVWEGEWRSD